MWNKGIKIRAKDSCSGLDFITSLCIYAYALSKPRSEA